MRRYRMGGWAAACMCASLAWADGGAASAPTQADGVRLECLPSGDAAGGWRDWVATRLALRGLEENPHGAWRLCFTESQDQQWVSQPYGWRDEDGWRGPPYRLETWPMLELTVRDQEGGVVWRGRERLDGDRSRARQEAAARRLLDRMSLPQ
ncbi:hypothetical protein [Chromobacterium sp. IIBBL 290-4]|uniref:hypothetical protein n=1 Tax=Chromobacterium sp. IIBBL 290-4 TaxID=2953890 RepID=UPI0020B657A7|nr:hypothetical protein [Chromobacterium sp. IIBBL 290-4]UTH74591.1 hypothetical protein NKT35_00285 [Chromobacterium sp. IIBBL 290-4]